MNKRAVVAILVIIIIVIMVGVLVIMPMESKAPTVAPNHATTTATSSSDRSPAPVAKDETSIPDVIVVTAPLKGEKIASPLTISGKARGSWYFEATAPVVLKDASGTVIAHGTLKAQGNWMTKEFVPFTATLTFTSPATRTGTLILKNDNPSGDPKNQKELAIPVEF